MTNNLLVKTLGKERYNRDLAFIKCIKTNMNNICDFGDMFESKDLNEIDNYIYHWTDIEFDRLVKDFEDVSQKCNADFTKIAKSILKNFEGIVIKDYESDDFAMVPHIKSKESNIILDEFGIERLLDEINLELNKKGLTLTDALYNFDCYYVTLLGIAHYWEDKYYDGDKTFYIFDDFDPERHFYNILKFELIYLDDGTYKFSFSESPFF